MKKIFFNPWLLAVLGLLALSLLIWFVGPLVAIADWRPLQSALARGVLIALIVLIYLLRKALAMWRARSRNAAVVEALAAPAEGGAVAADSAEAKQLRTRFEQALSTLKNARFATRSGLWSTLSFRFGRQYLYELPWYVIIGAPGAGKTTALLNSGLQFPLASSLGKGAVKGVGGTRYCDWWFTDQAVLIDTAGRYTTHDSDPQADRRAWESFLALLKRARPRQPINGALIAVAATDLLTFSAAQRGEHAAALRARVQELRQAFGTHFPIYVIVTKCDLLAGFTDTVAGFDKEQRDQVWGLTFDAENSQQGTAAEAFGAQFDRLTGRLFDGLIDRMQHETDTARRARIYAFPQQFGGLRAPLDDLLQQAFGSTRFGTPTWLRGVYFASGTQEGTPIDRLLGRISRELGLERLVLPPLQSSGRSYFVRRMLTDVVFAESALGGTNLKWEARRQWLSWGAYALFALVFLGLCAAWSVSYVENRAFVRQNADAATRVKAVVEATDHAMSPNLMPILPAMSAFASQAALAAAPSTWARGFGLDQGPKLAAAWQQGYQRLLVDALLPRIALRMEQQMRTGGDNPELLYETLKAYLMLHLPEHFDAQALHVFVTADWEATLDRAIGPDDRAALGRHADALFASGMPVGALGEDRQLVAAAQYQLANVPLAQRVYNRLKRVELGSDIPEFTVAKAGGSSASLVFARTSGASLIQGMPGLYTYDGYHKAFQKAVEGVTRQLAGEQVWVLRVDDGGIARWSDPQWLSRMTDDVRRLYLYEYRRLWRIFVDDIQLVRMNDLSQSLQVARILSAPDNPLQPLLRAIVHETTLGAADDRSLVERAVGKAESLAQTTTDQMRNLLGVKPKGAAADAIDRPENIVDNEFAGLRQYVQGAGGGEKPPLDGTIALIGEVYTLLNAADVAVKSGATPPPSDTPNRVRADAARYPEPMRSLLTQLSTAGAQAALGATRQNLGAQVNASIGEFCRQAINGRYPFVRTSGRDVTPDDFARLFAPGGTFDEFFQKNLAPFVDTSSHAWKFRQIGDATMGTDPGTLLQFQRAAAIRDTFFRSGRQVGFRLEFKPIEMDATITQFVLDVDGQTIKYAHGPTLPATVQWPGPLGGTQVRIQLSPSVAGAASGASTEGPWALFRMFDRMQLETAGSPERFRVTFNVDGRRAIYDVTASSVQNPFRLRELGEFSCPATL